MKQKTPRRIIISHVYSSDNKGDAALTSVLIKDLKRRFPKAAIRILKLEPGKKNTMFEGVKEQPAFMQFALHKYKNPLLKLAYVLYMLPVTLLWAAWFRLTGNKFYLPTDLLRVANAYVTADLVVAVGGGYIRSRKGLVNRLNIPLLLHPLWFGHILGKPTVLYPQSVGPFMNKFEERLVAFVLRRMMLINLREDTSVQLLARLGVRDNVVRAVDSGFLLRSKTKSDVRQQYHIPEDALLVGVTVRSWLQGDAQVRYEQAVAAALDMLVQDYGARILFIPQVTAAGGDDDRVASRRVHGYMRHMAAATRIVENIDHHQIKSIYDELDILLGTRFHSVIFSLTSFVPVLAIEYEHKTSGIMRDLDLDKWVIKIDDITTDGLCTMLRQLLSEQARYRTYLQQHIPPYVRRAQKTAEVLSRTYAAQEA